MEKKIIGIIPARYASTRFPRKLLAKLTDKTILQYTYDNAKESGVFDQLIVATDDDRIASHVTDFGGEFVMTSVNCPSGTDRIAEVLHQQPKLLQAEVIFNIQGDEPTVERSVFQSMLEAFRRTPQSPVTTAATTIHSESAAIDPHAVKCVVNLKGQALYFSRAMIPCGKEATYNAQFPYYKHLGIYAFEPHFILEYTKLEATPLQLAEDLEQLKILEHGHSIQVALVESEAFGIDTEEDLIQTKHLLEKRIT